MKTVRKFAAIMVILACVCAMVIPSASFAQTQKDKEDKDQAAAVGLAAGTGATGGLSGGTIAGIAAGAVAVGAGIAAAASGGSSGGGAIVSPHTH